MGWNFNPKPEKIDIAILLLTKGLTIVNNKISTLSAFDLKVSSIDHDFLMYFTDLL